MEYEEILQFDSKTELESAPMNPRQAVAVATEISSAMVRMAYGMRLNELVVTLTWDENGKPNVAFRFDGSGDSNQLIEHLASDHA